MKFIVFTDFIPINEPKIYLNINEIKEIQQDGDMYRFRTFSGKSYHVHRGIPEEYFDGEEMIEFLQDDSKKIFEI